MKTSPTVAAAMPSGGAVKSIRAPNDAVKNMEIPAAPDKTGKESVGDIANRVAKSNTGGEGRAVQGKGNGKLDKDAFFKLMLTNLKNQDPTSPLKSHEMAAQLAQFSSLEQMTNINEVLKDMKSGQNTSGQYQALNLIGKSVSGDSSRIDRVKGDINHSLSFSLNEAAKEVKISIKDPEGKVIKSMELQNQPKGLVKVEWDGKDIEGRQLGPGAYKVSVDAKAVSGNKLMVDMQFKGPVTGIQFTEKGPIVFVGEKQIPLKEIKQIEVSDENNSTTAMMGKIPGGSGQIPGQMGAKPVSGRPIDISQMNGGKQAPKVLSMDQLDPSQKAGLEQALAEMKLGGTAMADKLSAPAISDPSQDILGTAVLNQKMKNQVL